MISIGKITSIDKSDIQEAPDNVRISSTSPPAEQVGIL